MMAKYGIIVLIPLFWGIPLFAQPLWENDLKEFLTHPAYANASVGIHLAEAATGKTIFEFNSRQLRIPASVLKMVATATALETLGPDYRFKTEIGYTGKVNQSALKGNLVIKGGGDPALGSEYFYSHYSNPPFLNNWAQQLKFAGISEVKGNLILDTSIYDAEKIPDTWIWEDMGNYYGAGTSPLTIYDNLFRITFRSPPLPGEPTTITTIFPNVPGLHIRNEVKSSNENRDLAYVFGSPLDGKRIIRGTIPKNRKAFTIKASNPFPEKILAADFSESLMEKGIFISGEMQIETVDPENFHRVYIQESPPLKEIIKKINTESINLFSEHLVKQIAYETEGKGTRKAGLDYIMQFWQNTNPFSGEIQMEDGSGVSPFNLVSPRFMTHLLIYMRNSSHNASVFMDSLPVAGEGTLWFFNREWFPGNTLKAKSGSMTRIRCYAGYLKTESGKTVVFSFMFNHFQGEHADVFPPFERLLYSLRKKTL